MKIDFIDVVGVFDKAEAILAVRDAAQRVVDLEGRDEKVMEVLINTDSATPLKDLLNPPVKPTKTVYQIAYLSSVGKVETAYLVLPSKLEFDNLKEALEETGQLKEKYAIGKNYFVVEKTVEA